MTRVVLADRHAKFAWAGHPNVYDGAIDRVEASRTKRRGGVVDQKERYVGRACGRDVAGARAHLRASRVRSTPVRPRADRRRGRAAPRRAPSARAHRRLARRPRDGDRFPGLFADRYGPWSSWQITTFAAAQRRTEIATRCSRARDRRVGTRVDVVRKAEGFHPGRGRLAAKPPGIRGVPRGRRRVEGRSPRRSEEGHFLDQPRQRADSRRSAADAAYSTSSAAPPDSESRR